jgi:hypothetical protein
MENRLHRAIIRGLRQTLHDHGPITSEWFGSAAKRIYSTIISEQIVLQQALHKRMNSRYRAEHWRRRKAELVGKLLLNELCGDRSVDDRWQIWKDANRTARRIVQAEKRENRLSFEGGHRLKSPSDILEVPRLEGP